MDIDDVSGKKIEAFKGQMEGYVGQEAAEFALGVIAHLSIVGIPFLDLRNGLAQKRVWERLVEVLSETDRQLKEIEHDKVNKEYFKSEEFQTLITLIIEQLGTTEDKDKRRMLASALANSCTNEFKPEPRKELFLRILRDLSPEHVGVLKELKPSERQRAATPFFWPKIVAPEGEKLAILQRLTANGLLSDFLTLDKNRHISGLRFGTNWSESEIKRVLQEYVNVPPQRNFQIAQFGLDFLKYLTNETE